MLLFICLQKQKTRQRKMMFCSLNGIEEGGLETVRIKNNAKKIENINFDIASERCGNKGFAVW